MTQGWGKIRQAASYAGVSTRTMRDWLKMGLKHSRVRGCILIKFADIDTYLELCTANNNTEDLIDQIVKECLK